MYVFGHITLYTKNVSIGTVNYRNSIIRNKTQKGGNKMAKNKCGTANEKRKYKNDPDTRRVWRENYHRYVKPKKEAKLLLLRNSNKKKKAGEK